MPSYCSIWAFVFEENYATQLVPQLCLGRDPHVRCKSILDVNKLFADITKDKFRAKSMGKPAVNQLSAQLKESALMVVLYETITKVWVFKRLSAGYNVSCIKN